jgi:hypothetical protein
MVAQMCIVTIEVADPGLRFLARSGTRLVLAKAALGHAPTVAWLAWDPARLNTVTWHETYGIYAADIPEHDGAPIRLRTSVYPARERSLYLYRDPAFGNPHPSERIPPGHVDVSNASASAAAFGLVQTATVNGDVVRAPVNAVVLPPAFTADFNAVTTVHVWAQAGVAGGTIVPDGQRNGRVIAFDAARPERRFRYDERTATFAEVQETFR